MKIAIRLLRDWDNAGQKWTQGQILNIDESDAQPLIEQGLMEVYEPKAEDVIVVSPHEGETGFTMADFQKFIDEAVDKIAKAQHGTRPPPVGGEDDFAKKGGFSNFAHFVYDVYKSGPHGESMSENLLKWVQYGKASGMSEGVSADGGFLVPAEFRATLLQNALDASIVRQRATIIPMATNTIKVPTVVDTSHASSVFGGVIIYRPGEGAAKTSSKPEFGQVQLTLHKLVGLCYGTDELLEDSPISIEPLLTRMFSEAIAWWEDEDFINGTGANQALGVVNAPCLVSVAKETGQAATTIVAENIDKMYARMPRSSRRNAVWLANDDCYKELAALERVVGTGGAPAGLLVQLPGEPEQRLCAKPLILNEHMQTLGTVGDILFCDWRQYLIGQKTGSRLKVDTSIHLKFDYDETAFRFVQRYDGQPWWASALTPKHSSDTLSPFVALATRS